MRTVWDVASESVEAATRHEWAAPQLIVQSIADLTRNGRASACDGPFTGNRGRRCRGGF